MKNSSSKVAKTLNPKSNKLAEKKQPASHRLRSLVLIVIFILCIVTVLVTVLIKVKADPIESFLPQDQTVGFIEFKQGILPSALQMEKGQTVIPALQILTQLPLSKLPTTWWDHPFGLILMEEQGGANAWVFFAEGPSRRQMFKDVQTIGLESGGLKTQKPLYTYTRGLNFDLRFSNHYVFISSSSKAIEALKSMSSQGNTVAQDSLFQKAQNHTSSRAWIKAYVQSQKVNLPEYPAAQYAISSMSHAVGQAMMSVQQQSNGLQINTWLNLGSSEKQQPMEHKGNLEEMAMHVPYDSTALFVAGPNLTRQWQATLTQLSELNPAYGVVLESLVRAQVQELFGGNVNLRNDLYPLFENPYAFVLGQQKDGFALGMVVEHGDKGFTEVKLDKLLKGFYALVGKLNPQVKVVDLPDGTQSRELVANSQNAEELTEEYGQAILTCLSAQVKNFSNLEAELLRGFCYTLDEERFYLATSPSLLKHLLDATHEDVLALGEAGQFKTPLAQTGKNADQLTYVNMAYLAPFLTKTAPVQRTEMAIEESVQADRATNVDSGSQGETEPLQEDPSVSSAISSEEVKQNHQLDPLFYSFLAQLGQSTWVKHSQSDGVKFEGFMRLE